MSGFGIKILFERHESLEPTYFLALSLMFVAGKINARSLRYENISWCIDIALEFFHCFEARIAWWWFWWIELDVTAHTFLPSTVFVVRFCLSVFLLFLLIQFISRVDSTRLIYYSKALKSRFLAHNRSTRPRKPPLDSCPPQLTVIEGFERWPTTNASEKLSFINDSADCSTESCRVFD